MHVASKDPNLGFCWDTSRICHHLDPHCFLAQAQKHKISVIGQLKCGLNLPSWNKLLFAGTYLSITMKTGLITGIISKTEGVVVRRTFAYIKDYQVDRNKEMTAIGLMNIVGSCTSCYVTTEEPSHALL